MFYNFGLRFHLNFFQKLFLIFKFCKNVSYIYIFYCLNIFVFIWKAVLQRELCYLLIHCPNAYTCLQQQQRLGLPLIKCQKINPSLVPATFQNEHLRTLEWEVELVL